LSCEIWIFRNGHPDRDADRIIIVAMSSTDRGIVYLCCSYDFMLHKNY